MLYSRNSEGERESKSEDTTGKRRRDTSAMPFSPTGQFRCFLCTRNRPRELARCLDSLTRSFLLAFPGRHLDCFIFDDSTSETLSAETACLCRGPSSAEVTRHYVRTAADIAQVVTLPPSPFLPQVVASCKQLGSDAWDLAGVRNLAFLCALSCSQEEDLLLFLDDDILFESAWYAGHWIAVDGVAVLRQLIDQTIPQVITASGVGYYGRHDTSLRQHLALIVKELRQALCGEERLPLEHSSFERLLHDLSHFPHTMPIRLNLRDNHLAEGGPGLSGAVLATTPVTLRSHGLPRWYNEDWTWLSLLESASLQKIEAAVLHAAPPQTLVTHEFFRYQVRGDIIYAALAAVLASLPSHLPRLSACQQQLSPQHFTLARQELVQALRLDQKHLTNVIHRLCSRGTAFRTQPIALPTVLAGLHAITRYLEDADAFARSLDSWHLWDEVQRYFASMALWRSALH
jgi:hypothetical protein